MATQIAELQRELVMRQRVYPRFVRDRKLTQEQATERIDILVSTIELLQWILSEEAAEARAAALAAEGKL